MRIPRFQLFEFHDQHWFPAVLRRALTEWLRALWDYSRSAEVVTPVLESTLRRSGAKRIVDLCSGSSGPMISVQRRLATAGLDVPVLATDKFPDVQAMAEL